MPRKGLADNFRRIYLGPDPDEEQVREDLTNLAELPDLITDIGNQ